MVFQAHYVVHGLLAHVARHHIINAGGAVASRILGHALALDHVNAERHFEKVNHLWLDRRWTGQHELQAAA